MSALRISPPVARAITAAWSAATAGAKATGAAAIARLSPPPMVDEHGHDWTAARIAAEFVILATLMGTPLMIWAVLA